MKYNNTNSDLLSSLACGKNNLLIKNRLDRDKNIDLLYKEDAGIFSAAITRNNHELLQMLLDYMEQSGQIADEYDRLCEVLGQVYIFNQNCSKEIKEIIYKYISYDMSDDSDIKDLKTHNKSLISNDFSANNMSGFEDPEDINSKIREVNNKFVTDEGDTSTSEGSDKKKEALEVKLQDDFCTHDFSDILPSFSDDRQETDLSGNPPPDCHTFD